MELQNVTRNQHFVPQVEQRLNAINPLADEENQRIYAFNVDDRETFSISLESKKGFKISKTLSLTDLFSFDVLEKEASRYNFETLFHQYESNIRENTQSLINKLPSVGADTKSEILNIFASKFLNFVRNPYSIKKVLNTFPALTNIHPTDPTHYRNFERVLNGRKPQQEHLCNQLNVSEQEYADWLSVLFLLLTPLEKGQPNFFEQMVKGIYENPDLFIRVFVYTYDNKTCLLSDRGYNIPIEGTHMAWDFNLCSNSFIRYLFGNIDALPAAKIAPKELVAMFKTRPKSIDVHHQINDLVTLEKYNRQAVYQCFNTVFSSSIDCYGVATNP